MLFSSETKTSQHKQVSVRGKERTHFKGFSGNVEEEHWRGASALKCSEHGEVKGVECILLMLLCMPSYSSFRAGFHSLGFRSWWLVSISTISLETPFD